MNTVAAARIALLTVLIFVTVAVAFGGGQEDPPVTDTLDQRTAQKYVTVTFDDGYRSQYAAAEALERRGMQGVFFIAAGQLNGSFQTIPTMTGSQVRDLQQRGHEIGGHTYNHDDLSTLDENEVRTSLVTNRAALQELGIDPVSFAYPFGRGETYNETVMEYYDYARTVSWELNQVPPQEPATLHTVSLTENNYDRLDTYLNRMEDGDWLIIALHHVDAEGQVDRPDVDVSKNTYETILDTVEQADARVVTFRDVQGLEGE